MARRADRKPAHAATERPQENEFEVQDDERDWAGQHGQHPASAEEKQYRPRKGSSDGRPDENSD